ncbi:MAG: hypothetical protein A3C08_03390 [Candidatus Taylorbacteria bacterium RIFCSPHIGHO2_02_FULL_47_18]|nr:MAG: hypothetical protein A3C08_03390 [Candidatus Taylorbacteria bacterium RIFCSPHIGHO2_02_FULL_47_18]OHA41123.1 MAG: hypothetical protein A3J31_03410 [Candidatus Taylorbacteria bacterium RIFCSPLOWO2_02_FULL_48_16]OHA45714.1 MAG: hypothetical protein A3H13_00365 [Candidatus Taylorbacteria bacterium RIFCSPLOWO2_12_FULL_48_11]
MEKTEKIIALILARGGSKRIPRKNLAEVGGKPFIAWTIEEAKRSRFISRIIVSTDDTEIAKVAKKYGAEAPFVRPKEIAEDLTPDLPVFEHALRYLKGKENITPDIIAHLRVNTGLFRTVEDIDKGIEILLAHPEYDSVRAVIPAPLHPLKTYRLDGETLVPFVPSEIAEKLSGLREPFNEPVQKLPKAYAAAGYFSAIRPRAILSLHSMTGKKVLGYVVPTEHAMDIDEPEELAYARWLLRARGVLAR